VGSNEEIDVEVHDHLMKEGDIYLLCSDGLTDMLDHVQIQLVLRELGDDLNVCCKTLVELANQQGGLDNISVVLLRIKELQERGFMEYIFAS
jgi:protein phosphatase